MREGAGESFEIVGEVVGFGETRDLLLEVSKSYSGYPVSIPFRVIRGSREGPTVLVTAAVHGDELNGTGAIRELLIEPETVAIEAGTLILVPVVNILGFERKTRYLPDRRDLNRSFPGSEGGSLARRVARRIFRELVEVSDYCIDLHTAAVHRTNFPNVRGDLGYPEVARLARAFGCALVVDSSGPDGSLRKAACEAGHAMIILEAGEIWKVEPAVVEIVMRGVRNVLIELGMLSGRSEEPAYRAVVDRTTWLRSDAGGLLRFFVAPGDVVEQGQPIAQCTTLLAAEVGRIHAPADGVVLSLTTLPTVKPGDPVCHVAIPREGIEPIQASLRGVDDESLHERLRDDLASSVMQGEAESE